MLIFTHFIKIYGWYDVFFMFVHVTSQRHGIMSTLIAIQCDSLCINCWFLNTGLVDNIGVQQTPINLENTERHFCFIYSYLITLCFIFSSWIFWKYSFTHYILISYWSIVSRYIATRSRNPTIKTILSSLFYFVIDLPKWKLNDNIFLSLFPPWRSHTTLVHSRGSSILVLCLFVVDRFLD